MIREWAVKQFSVDTYTIAWFSLAEYVARGEKERALGLFRLLSHSLQNPALVAQLEGDLLWAFNDQGAYEKYFRAAQLYVATEKMVYALGLFEHLIALTPDQLFYKEQLLLVVKGTQYAQDVIPHIADVSRHYIEKKQFQMALDTITMVPLNEILAPVAEDLIRASIHAGMVNDDLQPLVLDLVSYWMLTHGNEQIRRLVGFIKQTNSIFYCAVEQLLSKK